MTLAFQVFLHKSTWFLTPSLSLTLLSHISVLSVPQMWPALSFPGPLFLLSLLPWMLCGSLSIYPISCGGKNSLPRLLSPKCFWVHQLPLIIAHQMLHSLSAPLLGIILYALDSLRSGQGPHHSFPMIFPLSRMGPATGWAHNKHLWGNEFGYLSGFTYTRHNPQWIQNFTHHQLVNAEHTGLRASPNFH